MGTRELLAFLLVLGLIAVAIYAPSTTYSTRSGIITHIYNNFGKKAVVDVGGELQEYSVPWDFSRQIGSRVQVVCGNGCEIK